MLLWRRRHFPSSIVLLDVLLLSSRSFHKVNGFLPPLSPNGPPILASPGKRRTPIRTLRTNENLPRRSSRPATTSLHQIPNGKNDDNDIRSPPFSGTLFSPAALPFTALLTLSGAVLGPLLDSYHGTFGVLTYDAPITLPLWQSSSFPAVVTTFWVPPLFGLAAVIIGWLYIVLDAVADASSSSSNSSSSSSGTRRDEEVPTTMARRHPSPFLILAGISLFTFQYYLSGVLSASGVVDRGTILNVMSVFAVVGFGILDGSAVGFLVSLATALGGPLIEVGLIRFLPPGVGYHYNDLGETGFFPLWIVPVYFLGGPAVGNLARGYWGYLNASTSDDRQTMPKTPCPYCRDTRAVSCPNCDAQGYYVTYNTRVKCNCCKGRGLVICRACFGDYGDDPNDLEGIRQIMNRMPD